MYSWSGFKMHKKSLLVKKLKNVKAEKIPAIKPENNQSIYSAQKITTVITD